MNTMFQLFGYTKWWILSKFGRKVPLVITVTTHLGCNLRCRHCNIAKTIEEHPELETRISYDAIVKELEDDFRQGARIAYFEGGETTLWRDGDMDLGDLIDVAKKIGFYNVGYTTNGTTGRIFTNSDVISISLDGPKEVHDYVRGEGVFDKLMGTLEDLDFDGAVFANMVLQKGNLDKIAETAAVANDNPRITGIVFNFLTPPPYDNSPSLDEKKKAVAEIAELKRQGYPILNSKKGLQLLTTEDWDDSCPRYMSAFLLPGEVRKNGCPAEGTDSCKHCGFAAVREYYLVNRGSISSILEMSSVFAMGKKRSK